MAEGQKKPRAKRRNYERELRDLAQWATISLQVYEHLVKGGPVDMQPVFQGRIEALKEVLGKLGPQE